MATVKSTLLGNFSLSDSDSSVCIQLRKYSNDFYRVYHTNGIHTIMKQFKEFRDAFYYWECEIEDYL